MKIKAPFIAELNQLLAQMGAPIKPLIIEIIPICQPAGEKVKLSEVEEYAGLLTHKDRQVVVFIPDHSYKGVSVVLEDPKRLGMKFHFAECTTLKSMRKQGRYEHRYHVHQNIEGQFEISDQYQNAVVELAPCRNCLEAINYRGYNQLNSAAKNAEVSKMTISELYSTYSTVFRENKFPQLPKTLPGYTEDWASVSKAFRALKKYTCECCGVDLNQHKNLLHAHHIDGNKRNNAHTNLQALCADCHRKQPMHGHMLITHEEMETIQTMRVAQGLVKQQSWSDIYTFTDAALHGVLHYFQTLYPCPKLNGEITAGAHSIKVAVYWPDQKIGLSVKHSKQDKNHAKARGWTLLDLNDASARMP